MALLDDLKHALSDTVHRELAAPAETITPDRRPTVLIAGASDMGPMTNWAERAGFRCVGQIAIERLHERLSRSVSLDLVLLDLRGVDVGSALDAMTARTLAARHGLAPGGPHRHS